MASDRPQRAFELFDAALALPEGEREKFLAQECSRDTTLIDDVRSLLLAHREAAGFLSSRRGSPSTRAPSRVVPQDLPSPPEHS